MKRLVVFAIVLAAPATVSAQVQFDGRSVPCRQLVAVVQSRGAVVIGTGPRPETAVPAWISTPDVAQCPVGYVCRDRATFTTR